MKRRAFTFPETLIVGALFGLFLLVGTLILSVERSRSRDAKRLADMTRVAANFAVLYAQQATYTPGAAGCDRVGALVSSCQLNFVFGGVSDVRDPGRFKYTIAQVPDENNFVVSFSLERKYGSLLAGKHFLDKNGIH